MTSANGEERNPLLLAKNQSKFAITTNNQINKRGDVPRIAPTKFLASGTKASVPLNSADQRSYFNGNRVDVNNHQILHQYECSSNQSGSDSGFGYPNSFSSDNNSYVVNAQNKLETTLTSSKSGIEQSQQNNQAGSSYKKRESTYGNDVNGNEIVNVESTGNFSASKTSPKSPANRSMDGNGKNVANKDLNNRGDNETSKLLTDAQAQASSASTDKISQQKNRDSCIESKHNLMCPSKLESAKHETRSTKESSDVNGTRSKVRIEKQHGAKLLLGDNQENVQPTNDESGLNTASGNADDEPDDADALEDSTDHDVAALINDLHLSCSISNIDEASPISHFNQPKSTSQASNTVLNLRSALKKSSTNSAIVLNQLNKASRSVTFNQTVIVFCEEIETSSPSDQCDLPIGYQDTHQSSGTTTPDSFTSDQISGRKKINKASLLHDYVRNDLDLLSKLVGEDASKLTDEQLFDLLENASLLEDFEPQADDYPDETELTIGRLNPGQSYLCHDALSDSDESISSQTLETQKEESHVNLKRPLSIGKNENRDLSKTTQIDGDNTSQSELPVKVNDQTHQKSLPARMRVSTVENTKRRIAHNRNDEPRDLRRGMDPLEAGLLNGRNNLSGQVAETADRESSQTVMVKQANIEPIAISKSILVRDNVIEHKGQQDDKLFSGGDRKLVHDSQKDVISHLSTISSSDKPDSSQQQRSLPIGSQELHSMRTTVQHPLRNPDGAQIKAQVIHAQPTCHVCRAIESSQAHGPPTRTQNQTVAIQMNNLPLSERANLIHPQINQLQLTQARQRLSQQLNSSQTSFSQSTESNISNQTCISCRKTPLPQNFQKLPQQLPGTFLHQQPRPVTCQLVYVVDQNGNRIRALQVVGQAQNQAVAGQSPAASQIILAPTGGCFTNPGSFLMQQGSGNYVQTTGLINQGPTSTSNPQYTMIARPPQQHNMTTACGVPTSVNEIGNNTDRPTQCNPRHHTVYCVKQPLGTQNIRQSMDSVDAARSFPDPHEVRRLDGLRGPTSNISLTQRDQHRTDVIEPMLNPSNTRYALHKRDDADDPSFGFSNRPAVKVFQACNNSGAGKIIRLRTTQLGSIKAPYNPSAITNEPREATGPKGQAPVIYNSQTLDRRGNVRNVQFEKQNMISSTSSMSDINRSVVDQQDSSYKSNNMPQSKVLNQANSSTSNDSPGSISAVSSRQSHPDTIISSNTLSKTQGHDRPNLKRQEKAEISYTMDI